MLKACVPTEEVAVWGQPPADRLGHSDDWQHAWHPDLGFSSPAVGIFVYLPWKHNNLPSSDTHDGCCATAVQMPEGDHTRGALCQRSSPSVAWRYRPVTSWSIATASGVPPVVASSR